ncbi:MAG: restriction endonuclease subunit S [Armatimonadetes bacterium]|nr:restriction endonuclease subunit S [Armatimonadota bacterium]
MVATASKDEIERFRIKIGDVIITKDSELWSDIGVPAVVRYEADDLVCGYHLAILRPKADELSGEFLLRCLQDRLIATQLHVAANGITRYGLSQGSIKSCLIPVPPLGEQGELVSHLMEATRDLTLAISKAQAEIDLIREYRTRLVADVVTGQLDVRHLDLPEVEESLIEAIDAVESDDPDEELEAQEVE